MFEKKYYLVLATIGGRDEVVSRKVYSWREVLGLAERFQGRPADECFARMRQSEL